MARLDPRLWGDRQEVHVKEDWSKFTVEERERRALKIIGMCREVVEMRKEIERFKREGPRPIVYDPTDADELAEATAAAEFAR